MKVALSVHLEAKTAYLCRVLAAGGAEMYVTGSNPLSTQDDVAAALAAGGLEVHATHGATPEEYEKQLEAVLAVGPQHHPSPTAASSWSSCARSLPISCPVS